MVAVCVIAAACFDMSMSFSIVAFWPTESVFNKVVASVTSKVDDIVAAPVTPREL